MAPKNDISPYLQRPLRSLEEVLRQRRQRFLALLAAERTPPADNSNRPPEAVPPAKSA